MLQIYGSHNRNLNEFPESPTITTSPSKDAWVATQERDAKSNEINQWVNSDGPLSLQDEDIQYPLTLSTSRFAEVSFTSENPVQKIQIYGYNKVTLTLKDGKEVTVESHFLDIPKLFGAKLAEYIRQSQFVVSKLVGGGYKVATTLRLYGGGCASSTFRKRVDVSNSHEPPSNVTHIPSDRRRNQSDDASSARKGLFSSSYSQNNASSASSSTSSSIAMAARSTIAPNMAVEKPVLTADEQKRLNEELLKECGNKDGKLANVRKLIQSGAQVNCVSDDEGKMNPLHRVVSDGNLDIIDYLLRCGSNIDAVTQQGLTPLGLAFILEKKAAADILLANGAKKIGDKDIIKKRAEAHIVSWFHSSFFSVAKAKADLKILKLYIDAGVDINYIDSDGRSFLNRVVSSVDDVGNIENLLDLGADIDHVDKEGFTSLGRALYEGFHKNATVLTKRGAKKIYDKSIMNKQKAQKMLDHALYISYTPDNLDLFKLLVDSGANINFTHKGNSTLSNALAYFWSRPQDLDSIKYLISKSADINIIHEDGWTPLGDRLCGELSRSPNSIAEVEPILKLGANKIGDKNILTKDKQSVKKLNNALFKVCGEQRSLRIAEMLVDAGAEMNCLVGQRGFTPLNIAIAYGHRDIIEYLLTHGVDIDAINGEGNTALNVACEYQKILYIKALLRLGADPKKVLPSVYEGLSAEIKLFFEKYMPQSNKRNTTSISSTSATNTNVSSSNPSSTSRGASNVSPSMLSETCKTGDLDIVKLAIKKGAKPDSQTLTWAFLSNNPQIVEEVIGQGAQYDKKTLSAACSTHDVAMVQKAISLNAPPDEDTEDIANGSKNKQIISLVKGVIASASSSSQTKSSSNVSAPASSDIQAPPVPGMLTRACITKSLENVQAAIQIGQKPDAQTLNYAVDSGNLEIVRLICTTGAPAAADTLTRACKTKNKAIVDLVIISADVTPDSATLTEALKSINFDIVDLVCSLGAKPDANTLNEAIGFDPGRETNLEIQWTRSLTGRRTFGKFADECRDSLRPIRDNVDKAMDIAFKAGALPNSKTLEIATNRAKRLRWEWIMTSLEQKYKIKGTEQLNFSKMN